ncbi:MULTISPECIES: helix-turn-helix transcriptional regulator [unclassified Streptomyces]|uniref:helix-turn-helix domain-containing protein n=1 Tax=unclassified Streptomyces TaxID=2593676 RepID=UPI002E78C0EE|nr:helix-turn-helix transcriptional regulator [Streptomyces sp. JV190]MEE1845426.1 helix-turn-helix transcriptional regulator [Streptomyces sp. JV190]
MTDGVGMAGGAARSGGEPEPTESLRTFGEVVKVFRKRALLTQEQFAPRVQYSVPTVASIEQGRRFPPLPFVERSEIVLDAFGAIRAAAKHLSRRPGIASWFQQWARLEMEAINLYTYECRLLPGLLQSESYARALFLNQLPLFDDEQIERQLAARMERQQLLRERINTGYSFILEEHLFLRRTGGTQVTREAIDHILELAELRNVEIQIMPQVRESHAGLDGPIQLLETPEHKWYGYSEGQESGQLHADSAVVSMLQMRYAKMRSQAHTPEDSVSLLRQMRGAL